GSIVACPQVTRSSKRKTHERLLRNDSSVGDTLESALTEPIPCGIYAANTVRVASTHAGDYGGWVDGYLMVCHRPGGIMDEPLEKSFIQEMRGALQKQLAEFE